MDSALHRCELTILESHLDTFGHVNNATYLRILEDARWDWLTGRGYGLDKVLETGLGPTILEIHMKFRKEIKLREKVSIEIIQIEYKKKIAKLKQVIKNHEGSVCFEGEFVFGLFDIKNRKLIMPTPEWLFAVGASDSL